MSTLRLLLLEDNLIHAEAIQAMLTDCNLDYELRRVETRADFGAALKTEAFDLILADCAVPNFDGIAVLEVASALCPEIPLIILADSLDEDRAIALLNQGATDYVLKPRLGRLGPCVQRALRETAERRKQQTALRELEAKYYPLFQSMEQGFCLCELLVDQNGDPIDYRLLEVNLAFEQLTGLEHVTGKTARELVPNLETYWFETYGRVVQTGKPARFEHQSIAMNRWFDVSAFRIGEPPSNQFAVLFTNITERKQLEQNRDRFLGVGSDLQAITGYNGYFQWVSPTFERLLGWTLDEITARPWADFVHPDDVSASLSETARLLDGNETIAFENRYCHKDGSYRWLLWNAQPYPEDQLLYGTAVDITEAKQIEGDRKQAEQALRESEAQSRNILESITDAFFGVDENWQFVYVNQSAETMLNRNPGDLIGKNLWEEYSGLANSKFEAVYRGAMRDRMANSFTAYYPDHDRWYEVHVYPAQNGISVYFRNVTEQIQAAETLRHTSAAFKQQVQKFDAVKSSVPDFIYTFDLAGRFIDVNQPLLDVWQKTLDEAIGKTFFELEYPVDVAAKLQNQIQEVIQTRRSIRDETLYTSAIGTRAYEYIFVPIFNAENGVEMVAGVARDITDRKAAEAELRESEARFHTLADNMSQFAWMADPNGWIFWYNHRWFEYTGTTLEEMQGWGWQQIHHPDHVDRVVAHFRHCLETGETWEDTFLLRGKDGTYRWFLSRAIPIKDEAGSLVQWFGTNTDIGDLKQIEAELRQKNAILDVINESTPMPIFVKDRRGRIIYANPATLKVLGKSEAEVIGYRDSDLYSSAEDAAKVMESDQRIMEIGQTEVVEESPDGIRTFLGMKAPYRNEAGEVIGLVGISNDISDRKRIEAEREQLLQQAQAAQAAAEQANRMKDEFLAVVSHELRTPLNPILGWSKLLQSGKLPPEKAAIALGTIERNAQQQAQLIDDLLDISRILQNKLTLAIAPIDLTVIITNALETVRLSAEVKGIELKFESASKVANSGDLRVQPINHPPFQVLGDASRLQQIVWNLLSNAIKFTPDNGRVEVKLERDEFSILSAQLEDATQTSNLKISPAETLRVGKASPKDLQNSKTYAQIIVRDTGKGIQPEFLPHLFEAFRQEDATTTRKFGGLGLGLSIVQRLVALHEGTITAASDGEGKGSTFTVRLPIAPRRSTSSALSSSDRSTLDLSGVKILVVDDIIDSQEFVVFALEQAGAIVTPASSAQAALELLAQMKPDVIISDIGMPDCNGYELLQQIRSDFIQLQTIPAIALSAYASEFDRQQAFAAGFQRHLAKPIDPEILVKTVALLTQLFQ